MEPVHGWAVAFGGKISMKTVSDTKQAAMVNGLFVGIAIIPKQSWSYDKIRDMFIEKLINTDRGRLVQVVVTKSHNDD